MDRIRWDAIESVAAELQHAGVPITPEQLRDAIEMVDRLVEADRRRALGGLQQARQQEQLDDVRRRTRERAAFSYSQR